MFHVSISSANRDVRASELVDEALPEHGEGRQVRAAAGDRVLDGVVNSGEFGLVVRAISGDEEGLAAEDIAVFYDSPLAWASTFLDARGRSEVL